MCDWFSAKVIWVLPLFCISHFHMWPFHLDTPAPWNIRGDVEFFCHLEDIIGHYIFIFCILRPCPSLKTHTFFSASGLNNKKYPRRHQLYFSGEWKWPEMAQKQQQWRSQLNDNEVELLLSVTPDYKVNKAQEKTPSDASHPSCRGRADGHWSRLV